MESSNKLFTLKDTIENYEGLHINRVFIVAANNIELAKKEMHSYMDKPCDLEEIDGAVYPLIYTENKELLIPQCKIIKVINNFIKIK